MLYIQGKIILKSSRIYKQESSRKYNTKLFINYGNYRKGRAQNTSNKATKMHHKKRAELFDYTSFLAFFYIRPYMFLTVIN